MLVVLGFDNEEAVEAFCAAHGLAITNQGIPLKQATFISKQRFIHL
jgi:hypothetical protein